MRRPPLLRISALVVTAGVSLAAVLGLAPASGAATQGGPRACTAVEVIAHRGLHGKRYTEDTLAAFAHAMNHGVAQVEGDLRLSADGSWVFQHDPRIGRTTHGRGAVRSLPDAYLASVRNNDRRVGLTFLPSALDLLRQHPGVRFEIEVKPLDASVDDLTRLLDSLGTYGVSDRVLLTSRGPAVLDRIRELAPAAATGLITRDPGITPEAAQQHGSTVVLGSNASRPQLVAALRAAGLRVESWTIDHRHQYRRVVRSRSNAVITDEVPRVRSWCRR